MALKVNLPPAQLSSSSKCRSLTNGAFLILLTYLSFVFGIVRPDRLRKEARTGSYKLQRLYIWPCTTSELHVAAALSLS
jgi:uncharacterized membrane protein YidH (DUF202 family)